MFRWPQTRKEFWRAKINKNVERDMFAISLLMDQGWRVLTIWECAIKGPGRYPLNYVLQRCEEFFLENTREFEEISGAQRRELEQT